MKYTFAFLFLTISYLQIMAQKKLPVVKANSSKAIFLEEDNGLKTDWNIDPSIKRDVYTTSKISKGSRTVKIKTDIDSIRITVKKGEKKDFVILLKGKDSCLTRIESSVPKDFSNVNPPFHDSIRLGINEQNTMFVKTALNKDSLTLNFDTGSNNLSLTRETLKDKIKEQLKGRVNVLSIGNKKYDGFRIYQVELTGHGTDGRFGWDLFDGMVVEMNYDHGMMVVHSQLPENVKKDKAYEKLEIKYFDKLFFVETTIKQGSQTNKDWFLFDTGYQRTVMLDDPLLKEQNFPTDQMKIIKKVVMKGGQGNEIPVNTVNLESLSLGKYNLKNIPAQLLSESRPVLDKKMNILGNEILKRFNVFLDFQNNVVYIKPNKLFNDGYIEKE
ncbi:aspartyl protease family protein [Chryseobacterium sp. JUb7]|uniref:aspartyl protease family protein n=1 Tax=Chryseobacterium sp. JUb7 TaxID=2940599 RepID=UPI002167F242|nr:aspartyl protease family protein [Chryseobacterium sp. JUb7]MCS3532044.1 hypothetical protein [Chryseobacterium sp. JUb7]